MIKKPLLPETIIEITSKLSDSGVLWFPLVKKTTISPFFEVLLFDSE